jgi:hypothetical protein
MTCEYVEHYVFLEVGSLCTRAQRNFIYAVKNVNFKATIK